MMEVAVFVLLLLKLLVTVVLASILTGLTIAAATVPVDAIRKEIFTVWVFAVGLYVFLA